MPIKDTKHTKHSRIENTPGIRKDIKLLIGAVNMAATKHLILLSIQVVEQPQPELLIKIIWWKITIEDNEIIYCLLNNNKGIKNDLLNISVNDYKFKKKI
jgi:hypothetical protein